MVLTHTVQPSNVTITIALVCLFHRLFVHIFPLSVSLFYGMNLAIRYTNWATIYHVLFALALKCSTSCCTQNTINSELVFISSNGNVAIKLALRFHFGGNWIESIVKTFSIFIRMVVFLFHVFHEDVSRTNAIGRKTLHFWVSYQVTYTL